MGSSVVQYEIRLRSLLEKFLQPNYTINNDAYLNTLLSHISGKNNALFGKQLLDCPFFIEWILQAITQWETTLQTPTTTVSSFTLHLVGYLSQNETKFKTLNNKNAYIRLCAALKVRTADASPSIKLGYVKMLSSFINHKSGIEWLVASDYWQDALTFCLANQTVYIVREGHNFVLRLLSNGINYNEVFSELVVKRMLSAVMENHLSGSVFPEVNDSYLQKRLVPTLNLVTYVLEKVLESDALKQGDYRVAVILIKKYSLEDTFWSLLMMVHEEEFLFGIARILILVYFTSMVIDKAEEYIVVKEIRDMCGSFFKTMQILISKRCPIAILKMCHYGQVYWRQVKNKVKEKDDADKQILFENQMVILQILPIFTLSDHHGMSMNNLALDEFRDMYITKLFKISCENTIRMAYAYRGLLVSCDKSIYDVALKSVAYLMKSGQYFDRNRAVIVSQAMMFVMKDILTSLRQCKQVVVDMMIQYPNLLGSLIDGLSTMIVDFDISWRESVETICIYSISMEFLSSQHMTSKLIIQLLKCINLAISRFMTPNQVLLIDTTTDSSLVFLGPMLYGRLHDVNWEVRDSVLEILHSIAEIAYSKFPSFQKMILDNNLCSLVVTMSTDDQESYVRASALKCVTAMIRISNLWTEGLAKENLPEKVLSILKTETEGPVRCQAVVLMCNLYEYEGIADEQMDSVYTAMYQSTTSDLHWEVKSSALCFWDKVISSLLKNQGMIDGTFPNVTFSKEHRKIVTLTESEIRSRLSKVLQQLSERGCLSALVAAMRDDCDLEVTRNAVTITKKIAELLKKHNALFDSTSKSTSPATIKSDPTTPTSSRMDIIEADAVIEAIVNSKDINLLANVFKSEEKYTAENGSTVGDGRIMVPDVFKCFIKRDLDSLVNERARWLESTDDLGSLLDDMLKSYDNGDVNSMDCY